MSHDRLYSFVFKGLLTDVSLSKEGKFSKERFDEQWEAETLERLGIPVLESELVAKARKMSLVYTAICAFENSVRDLVEKTLLEEVGEDWWDKSVAAKIKEKAETRKRSESDVRWMTPRGSSPLYYTEFGDLVSVIAHPENWPYFEALIKEVAWAKQIITTLEKSRNIIMHSGELTQADIERVGMYIRDWVRQVG
jgi:hypothetical protein